MIPGDACRALPTHILRSLYSFSALHFAVLSTRRAKKKDAVAAAASEIGFCDRKGINGPTLASNPDTAPSSRRFATRLSNGLHRLRRATRSRVRLCEQLPLLSLEF